MGCLKVGSFNADIFKLGSCEAGRCWVHGPGSDRTLKKIYFRTIFSHTFLTIIEQLYWTGGTHNRCTLYIYEPEVLKGTKMKTQTAISNQWHIK